MKKSLFLLLLMLSVSLPLFAEKSPVVELRFSRQDSLIRIVLESEDEVIRNISTVASPAGIRIDFFSPFEIRTPQDFIFQIEKHDRFLMILTGNAGETRTYKLSSPARLVVDIRTGERPLKDASDQKGGSATDTLSPPTGAKAKKDASDQTPVSSSAVKESHWGSSAVPAGRSKIRSVLLDAGHGGYDYGIVSEGSREKDVNLKLVNELASALARAGYRIYSTRRADQSVPISERVGIGLNKRPDLFISLHAASSAEYAVYHAPSDDQSVDASLKLYSVSMRQTRFALKSAELAKVFAESLKSRTNTDVLVRELPLPALSAANGPAVLIEYPGLAAFSSDKKLRDSFIQAILEGIGRYE